MFEQIRLQIWQFIYFLLQVCLLVYLKGETLLDTPWTYDFLKKGGGFFSLDHFAKSKTSQSIKLFSPQMHF